MKRLTAIVSVLVLLALSVTACQKTGYCGGKIWSWREEEMAEMVTLINDARRGAGLSALSEDPWLTLLAIEHSKDMACQNFLDHVGSDGRGYEDRIQGIGDAYTGLRAWAENVGGGHPTARAQFDAWMASPGHHDNILNDRVRELGVGCIHISAGSRYTDYWTAVFILR